MTILLLIIAVVLVVLAVVLIQLQRQEIIKARRGWTQSQHALELSQQELSHWKQTYPYTELDLRAREDWARKDNARRSRPIVSGKVAEHMALFFPELVDLFNPRDAHFLGSPVDFVIFDGLDEGGDVWVRFREIKTGRSTLNTRERKVKAAIEAGRVDYDVINLMTDTLPEIEDGVSSRLAVDAPTPVFRPGPSGPFDEYVSDPIPMRRPRAVPGAGQTVPQQEAGTARTPPDSPRLQP